MLKTAPFLAAFAVAALFAPASAYAQQATSTPVLCAVKGEEIKDVAKAAGKADYKGKTYYFCCPGCTAAFNKADDTGKARFAKLTTLRSERLMLARKIEALDGEIKLASDSDKPAKKADTAITAAASGPVYCAVTGEEIGSAADAAAKLTYNNKTYYLCCPGCQVKWDKDPAKFAAEADKRAAAKK